MVMRRTSASSKPKWASGIDTSSAPGTSQCSRLLIRISGVLPGVDVESRGGDSTTTCFSTFSFDPRLFPCDGELARIDRARSVLAGRGSGESLELGLRRGVLTRPSLPWTSFAPCACEAILEALGLAPPLLAGAPLGVTERRCAEAPVSSLPARCRESRLGDGLRAEAAWGGSAGGCSLVAEGWDFLPTGVAWRGGPASSLGIAFTEDDLEPSLGRAFPATGLEFRSLGRAFTEDGREFPSFGRAALEDGSGPVSGDAGEPASLGSTLAEDDRELPCAGRAFADDGLELPSCARAFADDGFEPVSSGRVFADESRGLLSLGEAFVDEGCIRSLGEAFADRGRDVASLGEALADRRGEPAFVGEVLSDDGRGEAPSLLEALSAGLGEAPSLGDDLREETSSRGEALTDEGQEPSRGELPSRGEAFAAAALEEPHRGGEEAFAVATNGR